MDVERFIFGYGSSGRGVMVDASGRLLANAGAGQDLVLGYGDSGRAICVDASGRLMVNLDGTGGGGGTGASTGEELSITDASGFYPTHNGEAALALCGRNDKGMRTDINKQRTDFTNASGLWPKTATALAITDAGNYYGTHNVEAALQTAGLNDKNFTNASGNWVKTLASAGGTTLVATGSAPALTIKGLTAGSGIQFAAAATALTLNEKILIAKPFKTLTSAASLTIDLAQFNNYYLPLAHDATIAFTNPSDGQKILIVIKQTVGGNTVAWPTGVKWRGGSAPTLTATANAYDMVSMVYNSTLEYFFADVGQNFA